jgi:hypothetical protein
MPTETGPAHLCSGQCVFGTLTDLLTFMFRKGSKHVDHEPIRMWVIRRDEIGSALHQARYEVHISRKAIEFRDD